MEKFTITARQFTASSQWSLHNAFHMMKLSYAVYAGTTDDIGAEEDWSITQKLVEDAGYRMQKIEASEGIYQPNAMICWDDENVFLIFRGTEPLAWKQWATDVYIKQKEFSIGEVHSGFYNCLEHIWPQVIDCLRGVAKLSDNKQLFLGGHSLGAGMSQIAASKLVFEESTIVRPTAVYHFGCPRAFDAVAASTYNTRLGSNTFRVVNNNDIVCDLPLESSGYAHVGQHKYMTANTRLLTNPSSTELELDSLAGGLKSLAKLNLVDFISDHLPDQYTEALARLVEKELSSTEPA